MRFFVTGGTGFVGSALVKKLSEAGNEVHALVRKPEKASHIEFPGVTLFKGDITDLDSLEKGMKNCDFVFHVAAQIGLWAKDPLIFDRINIDGTRNVLECAKKLGIQRIVITSSAGIFGPSVEGIITEKTKRKMPFYNPYERTKGEAQIVVDSYAAKGLNVVTVSPSRIFGNYMRGRPDTVSLLVYKYVREHWRIIPGDGKRIGNYCYLDDVIQGHILAMEKGRAGENYILGGYNLSYDSFFNALAKAMGMPRKMIHVPAWLLQLVTYQQMAFAKLFGIPPILTPDWMAKLRYDWEIDISKSQNELGYTIIPLELAAEKTVDWYKNYDF